LWTKENTMDDNGNTGAASNGGTATGSGIVNSVKERATAQLSTQKGRAAEGLDVIAQAVRQTTQQLRNDQHDTIAQYADRAAEQLERFSSSVRDKDLNALLQDAQQLARRQPGLFIGGSFVLGLLAARFLKSSRQQEVRSNGAGMYESGRAPLYGSSDRQASSMESF
jgi:hypothetical protein